MATHPKIFTLPREPAHVLREWRRTKGNIATADWKIANPDAPGQATIEKDGRAIQDENRAALCIEMINITLAALGLEPRDLADFREVIS